MEIKKEEKIATDKKSISRRKLITYAWIAAGAIVAGELIGGVFAFLWPRRRREKEEKIFVAGKVSDFKIGEVVVFRKEKTFVVRLEAGFLAISSVCPHLHCVVNWNELTKKFECPCHGAKFNKEGEVLEGPPPRPLDIHKLEVAAGNVVINTEVTTERKKFDPSQLIKT